MLSGCWKQVAALIQPQSKFSVSNLTHTVLLTEAIALAVLHNKPAGNIQPHHVTSVVTKENKK